MERVKGHNTMMTVICRNGDKYVLQDEYGLQVQVATNVLKSYLMDGLKLSNAHLSKGGRIVRNTPVKRQSKKTPYQRTPELMGKSFLDKAAYYWANLSSRCLLDMSELTIDELDAIFCAYLKLETEEIGSSSVDVRLERNLYCFNSLSPIFKELINRKYLSEGELKKYLLGVNDRGRIINQISLADWILSLRGFK